MKEYLRVLYIAEEPTTGGATEAMVELVQGLRERFHCDVTILTVNDSEFNRRLSAMGIESRAAGHVPFLWAPPSSLLMRPISLVRHCIKYWTVMPRVMRRLDSFIEAEDFDLVHSNLPRGDLGQRIARRHHIPHIVHLRELSFDHFRCVSLRPHPNRVLLNRTDKFIAISESVREGWVRAGIPESFITTIYDAVQFDDGVRGLLSDRASGAGSRSTEKFKIVFLGGCSVTRGIWQVLKAVAEISRFHAVHLDVYGADSRATQIEARAFVKLRGLQDVITFHRADREIRRRLHSYDAAIVASRAEGFGRVVLEYQLSGIPVVAANTGALPELISHGKTGLLYDRREGPKALAAALGRLIDDPDECRRLASNARRSAAQFQSVDTVKAVFDVYQEVLADRVASRTS